MKLYQKSRTLLPNDYRILMEAAKGAKTAIEFGPGYSTYALIEAGVEEIVGLEHDPKWKEPQADRFKDYPQVTIDWYWDEAPVARVPESVSGRQFDVGFVDSPKGYAAARVVHPGQEECSRLNTCLAALRLAPVVYLHDARRPLERGTLDKLWLEGYEHRFIPGSDYGMARICRKQE